MFLYGVMKAHTYILPIILDQVISELISLDYSVVEVFLLLICSRNLGYMVTVLHTHLPSTGKIQLTIGEIQCRQESPFPIHEVIFSTIDKTKLLSQVCF